MHYTFEERNNFFALVCINLILYIGGIYFYLTSPPIKTIPQFFEFTQIQPFKPALLFLVFLAVTAVTAFTCYVSFRRTPYALEYEDTSGVITTLVIGLICLCGTIYFPMLTFGKFSMVFIIAFVVFLFMMDNRTRR